MSSRTDRLVAQVVMRQHGVIGRAQALDTGLTSRMIGWRLERGVWRRIHSGVYRLDSAPLTWRSRLMAACLAAGPTAVASHRAAAALWALDGSYESVVELTVAVTGQRSYRGVVVHRTRALPVGDRAAVDGIPATRPARTLIDLAAVVEGERLEMALDSALRDRHITIEYLDRRLAELGSRGRRGVELLRDLVDDRRAGRPADSQAENRVRRALVAEGLPEPVRQFELVGVATFDLAYPDRRIGIEFDSYRFHADRRQWRRDQSRHNRATALGWLVFHLTADLDIAPVAHAYRNRPAA